jgi:hypothetical protein
MSINWNWCKWLDEIRWIRYAENSRKELEADIKLPKMYFILGLVGSGKSALLENISNNYKTVIDLHGADDNEGLAWLRSPRKNSALLLKGPSVSISSEWDTVDIDRLSLDDISKYSVIVTCRAFYANRHEQWYSVAKLMEKIESKQSWSFPWCLSVREAANLLYSRVTLGENQYVAKANAIYTLRQMRHYGIAAVIDALRAFAVDIDVRELANYTFIKAQGIQGLPEYLHFLYSDIRGVRIDPYWVMRMDVDKFIIVAQRGGIGAGKFDCPPWHKTEHENLLEILNIEVKTNEPVNLGDKKINTTTAISDFEHVAIIQYRTEQFKKRPLSYDKIIQKLLSDKNFGLRRSPRTIYLQHHYHNDEIASKSECTRCRRAKSDLSKTVVP